MRVGDDIDGVEPVAILARRRGRDHRPQIDAAGHVGFEREMADRAAEPGAAPCVEGQIHEPKDRVGGAEGILQLELLQRRADGAQPLVEGGAHRLEGREIGALEGIDRLLAVADDEDRAPGVARPGAGGEFARQRLDHVPLRGAGILRLVHEDVIDTAIELEQHPLRHRRFAKQGPRAQDEIVKIQQPRRRLARRIGVKEGRGEAVQRGGARGGGQREPARARALDPRHQRVERVDPPTEARARALGGKAADLGGEGLPGVGAGQKQPLQRGQCLERGRGAGGKARRGARVGFRAVGHRRGHGVDELRLAAEKDLAQKIRLRESGRQPEQRARALRVERGAQGLAVLHDLGGQRLEILAGMILRDGIDGPGLRAVGHLLDDLGPQEPGGPVVHLAKLRRHLGLEREAAQQRCAERMDRLDLEPARRLDGAREKPARARQRLVLDGAGHAQIGERRVQRARLHHRPFPEPPEQPVLHLARGGLGVGQAQDVLRRDPVEQEPRHPVGEHPRLARSRIGRQPHRVAGLGRRDLPRARVVPHPTSSGFEGALISHSPKRAR